jgi:MSHA biogenesis protein MshJ
MKRWWTIISARVDALSLRERVFLFVTLLVLCMLMANVLWLTPAQQQHRQLTQRFAAQDVELQTLREELKNTSGETGEAKLKREQLAQMRERLAAVNAEIAATPQAREGETPLARVLVHFLRRHEGLVLVRTATLAPENRSAQAAGEVTGLRRQGLELTVAGPYGELARYVQTLERALPALRWGTMKMNSEQLPAQLTLQVWLVGGGT